LLPEKKSKVTRLLHNTIIDDSIYYLTLNEQQEAVDTKSKETAPSSNSDPFHPQISQDKWTRESLTSVTYFHVLYPA